MPHTDEHEDRLLAYALGDVESGREPLDGLVEQVTGCDECLAHAYEILGKLPVIVTALGATADVRARVEEKCRSRLDDLLLEVADRQADRDAEPKPKAAVIRFPAIRRMPNWGWVAVALAAGLAAVVFTRQVGRESPRVFPVAVAPGESGPIRRLPEDVAPRYLKEALEATPSGFGMGPSRGASPFRRGYYLGLLLDLDVSLPLENLPPREAASLLDDQIYQVWDEISPFTGGQDLTQAWPRVRDRGCAELAGSEPDERACRWGVFAYRLGRDIDLAAEEVSDRLRSEEALALLDWIESRARELPEAAEIEERLKGLRAARESGRSPDAQELAIWRSVIESLERNL